MQIWYETPLLGKREFQDELYLCMEPFTADQRKLLNFRVSVGSNMEACNKYDKKEAAIMQDEHRLSK